MTGPTAPAAPVPPSPAAAAGPGPEASQSPGRAAWLRALAVPAVVVGLCARSVVQPGYYLLVDIAFGPRARLPEWSFNAVVPFAVHLLGGAVGGRMVLAGTLFLVTFSPMVLFRRAPWPVQIAAGLLGGLNPFVYDRLEEGQWLIAAGAGGLCLWVAAFEGLQRRPGRRWALALAAATVGIVALDEHEIGMLLVLGLCGLVGTAAWRDPLRRRWTLAAAGLAGVVLLYGVVPFFLGHGGGTYPTVARFGRPDLLAFRSTASHRYGLWVNLLGLYGEWGERLGRFPLAKAGAPWWPIPSLLLAGAAVAGAALRRDRAWLLAVGGIGLLVSASTATPLGLSLALAAIRHLPLLAAYREPEKWSALWLLALVVLVPSALERAGRWRSGNPSGRAALPLLAGVVMVATLLPAGASMIRNLPGDIVPVAYPRSWTAAAAYLRRHVPAADTVLVLPWHLYEGLPFTGYRVTANPASVIFPGRLLTPTDLQIPGRTTEVPSPHHIGSLALAPGTRSCQLAAAVRATGIHWVVIEDAAGGLGDGLRLQRCGFRVREGTLNGVNAVAVLSG